MERKNISFTGAGGKGLAYLQICKEIENKNIKFDQISGNSAGAIFGAMLAQGMSTTEMKDALKELTGDKIMRWFEDFIQKRDRPFIRYCKGIIVYILTTLWVGKSMERKVIKLFSWDKVERNTKLFVSATPVEWLLKTNAIPVYMLKAFINETERGITQYNILKDSFLIKYRDVLGNIYFSDDGTYMYINDGFRKVSDETLPLGKAVIGSFWFPIFTPVKYKLNGEKLIMFDGGLVNNECNVPNIGKEFYQVSTDDEIPKEKEDSIESYYYNLARPGKGRFFKVEPINPELSMFSYYDEAIEKEYSAEPTNFFKDL